MSEPIDTLARLCAVQATLMDDLEATRQYVRNLEQLLAALVNAQHTMVQAIHRAVEHGHQTVMKLHDLEEKHTLDACLAAIDRATRC